MKLGRGVLWICTHKLHRWVLSLERNKVPDVQVEAVLCTINITGSVYLNLGNTYWSTRKYMNISIKTTTLAYDFYPYCRTTYIFFGNTCVVHSIPFFNQAQEMFHWSKMAFVKQDSQRGLYYRVVVHLWETPCHMAQVGFHYIAVQLLLKVTHHSINTREQDYIDFLCCLFYNIFQGKIQHSMVLPIKGALYHWNKVFCFQEMLFFTRELDVFFFPSLFPVILLFTRGPSVLLLVMLLLFTRANHHFL